MAGCSIEETVTRELEVAFRIRPIRRERIKRMDGGDVSGSSGAKDSAFRAKSAAISHAIEKPVCGLNNSRGFGGLVTIKRLRSESIKNCYMTRLVGFPERASSE